MPKFPIDAPNRKVVKAFQSLGFRPRDDFLKAYENA